MRLFGITASVLAVVALAIAAAAGAFGGGSYPHLVKGAPAPPSQVELRKLGRYALRAAMLAGDPHPSAAFIVPTRQRLAERVADHAFVEPNGPAYFIVLHGHFDEIAPSPPGPNLGRAEFIRESVLTLTISEHGRYASDDSLAPTAPDLYAMGEPEPLPLPPASPAILRASLTKPPSVEYKAEGVKLTAPRSGYTAPVEPSSVRYQFRRSGLAGSRSGKELSMRLWLVRDGHPARGSPYPAWVVTVPHTRDCTFVAIYDLLTLAWTDDFQTCPVRKAAAPSTPSAARRLVKSVPCLTGRERQVGPSALRRFHPVAAVSCIEQERIYPGHGQWEVLVRRVAVSRLAGLQRYFEQPHRPTLPKGDFCSGVAYGIVVPVLVDRAGNRLVPRTPVDRCGEPLEWSRYGLGSTHVRWQVVSVHKVRQLVSAPALAANCPMEWGNVVAEGEPRLRPGSPLFAPAPRTVHVCIYRAPADHIALGRFVRGKRLGPAETRRLLGALTGSPTSRHCAKQRTFAIVAAKPNEGASVELGGCWRVAPGYRDRKPNTADAAVVRAIVGVR